MIVVLLPLSYSTYAEESTVFTDDDLSRYHNQSMVDDQTLAQKEKALKAWEKASEKELLRAKRAGEEKRVQEERQKATQTVKRPGVSVPGGGYAQTVGNGPHASNKPATGAKHT